MQSIGFEPAAAQPLLRWAGGARRALALGLVVLLCGLAQAQDRLPDSVRAALATAQLPEDALAAVALPLGPFWLRPWQHQALRPMQPGSTMKLVTSIVALDRLGAHSRGYTELRSAAPLGADGRLQGDLVLKGGADPDLGVAQFWALLAELRASGVRSVQGNLVLDRSLWQPARVDEGLPPFDDAPEFAYNVIPDALNLAGALLPLQLSSHSGVLTVHSVPPLPGLRFDTSAMVLTDTPCSSWSNPWRPSQQRRDGSNTVLALQGGFPKDCLRSTELQLLDRTELAEKLFAALWQQLGGEWQGRALEGRAGADTRLLVRRLARPWGEVLRPLNKASDNALSRMLFMNLGVAGMAAAPQASTAALAAQVVQDWLAQHRIASAGLVLDNGSGLSRSERVTPLQLAQMLAVAHRAHYAPDLLMSLPVVGVDGTMRNRLKQSPATGWARLKTGTLSNVTALAGYVADGQGHWWAVAAIINHDQAAKGRPALDALMDELARSGLQLRPLPLDR
jgi:serine-type D-Ala-D-Ala carboxypeptidase/endopeptidase (penicillin-binding protein 4)